MKFHFGCISKRPDILMDMCRHFISVSVYMIFYQQNEICVSKWPIWNPYLHWVICTWALNPTSNKSALIHFVPLCSHENVMPVWNFILVKMNDMKSIPFLSLFSLQFIGTQVKSWLNTEVRFSTEMKSHTALSWFYLSCKRTLKKTIFPLKSSKTFGFLHSNLHSIKKHTLAKIPI